jgi:hypothetical protein
MKWEFKSPPECWAKHRPRYLKRVTEFDTSECKIIAWAEIGRSHHGIAKQVAVTQPTVKDHHRQIDTKDDTARLTRWRKSIEVDSVGKDTVWAKEDSE